MTQAVWIGRAKPINDTDAARKYWGTDVPAKQLAAEFSIANHSRFSRFAGPAVIDVRCLDCGEEKIASSRVDAETDIKYAARYRCEGCYRKYQESRFREQHEQYKEKQARSEELRWMPYRNYLGTDEWSERRKTVIRRAGFKCQVCAEGGRLHVHHRTYARRGVERIEDMIALCPDCHEIFHKHGRLAENGRAA
jgi:5-methylcytosine-specific restriction endonuclease McrA